jgi:N-acyl-D-aspartate/D-glutamate deacylase
MRPTAYRFIDATDKWVMPGMLDIHTHYDVEVLGGPSLSESLRHGVTTVVLGSCSLSTVHVGGVDAGDLFGRVEAIPREHVIAAIDENKTWTNCDEYVAALEALPLGPNLAAFIGHSDMRTAVMGLNRATRDDQRPTRAEQARMEQMLKEALSAGFVGMSSQQLLFDKIDGDTCRSRTLPSTYAKPRELRRLKSLLRRAGRVLQSGPDIQNPINLASQVAQSLGIFRNPLKTSLLSAADIKANPYAILMMGPLARITNALGGNFRWQHLPVPFEVYADGIDLVVFEEFGVRVWHRDFFDAEIVACPDDSVVDKSFGQVGVDRGVHPVDAFLDLVIDHGTALRWRTTISNHRPEVLKKLARDPVSSWVSPTPVRTCTGRFLRAAHRSPAPPMQKGELARVS